MPLLALVIRPWELGLADFWTAITTPRVLACAAPVLRRVADGGGDQYACSASSSPGCWCATAFPASGLLDALIDLPFALPTAVAGIALSTLYAPQWLDRRAAERAWHQDRLHALGRAGGDDLHRPAFHGAHAAAGAERLGRDVEEAAATLGATRFQTIRRVVLPMLVPALLTGAAMAFARARRRIRLRDLHRRQSADGSRDRAAADHHQAGAVRLCRRRRHRRGDAGGVAS